MTRGLGLNWFFSLVKLNIRMCNINNGLQVSHINWSLILNKSWSGLLGQVLTSLWCFPLPLYLKIWVLRDGKLNNNTVAPSMNNFENFSLELKCRWMSAESTRCMSCNWSLQRLKSALEGAKPFLMSCWIQIKVDD